MHATVSSIFACSPLGQLTDCGRPGVHLDGLEEAGARLWPAACGLVGSGDEDEPDCVPDSPPAWPRTVDIGSAPGAR
ncbi:hypothetical protein GCM10022403_037110 [Streptomyces coacervatus]|uniref:Uncharacterized protein n=1 Tax=Streptomyces coacervatus TaxID=647381 RepID=A0ABP7HPD6_9ACTN